MRADTGEDHKALIATAERNVARNEEKGANAAEHAAKARDRIARIERGQNEGGLGKPMTDGDLVRILRAAGITASDIRHAEIMAALPKAAIPLIVKAASEASDRASKRVARRLLARALEPSDNVAESAKRGAPSSTSTR